MFDEKNELLKKNLLEVAEKEAYNESDIDKFWEKYNPYIDKILSINTSHLKKVCSSLLYLLFDQKISNEKVTMILEYPEIADQLKSLSSFQTSQIHLLLPFIEDFKNSNGELMRSFDLLRTKNMLSNYNLDKCRKLVCEKNYSGTLAFIKVDLENKIINFDNLEYLFTNLNVSQQLLLADCIVCCYSNYNNILDDIFDEVSSNISRLENPGTRASLNNFMHKYNKVTSNNVITFINNLNLEMNNYIKHGVLAMHFLKRTIYSLFKISGPDDLLEFIFNKFKSAYNNHLDTILKIDKKHLKNVCECLLAILDDDKNTLDKKATFIFNHLELSNILTKHTHVLISFNIEQLIQLEPFIQDIINSNGELLGGFYCLYNNDLYTEPYLSKCRELICSEGYPENLAGIKINLENKGINLNNFKNLFKNLDNIQQIYLSKIIIHCYGKHEKKDYSVIDNSVFEKVADRMSQLKFSDYDYIEKYLKNPKTSVPDHLQDLIKNLEHILENMILTPEKKSTKSKF